jgi:hypothetical protein
MNTSLLIIKQKKIINTGGEQCMGEYKDISNRGIVLLVVLALIAFIAINSTILTKIDPATIPEDARPGFCFLWSLISVFMAVIAFIAICKIKWIKCYEIKYYT